MKKLKFKIKIDASRQKVWAVLWNDATYPKWTTAFAEGSYAVTDWKEGSKVKFLSPNGTGMLSHIIKSKPFSEMRFLHKGVVLNGKEDTESDGAKKWNGAEENYFLEKDGEGTLLKVEMDILENYQEEFEKSWPKALEKVRELAEYELKFREY